MHMPTCVVPITPPRARLEGEFESLLWVRLLPQALHLGPITLPFQSAPARSGGWHRGDPPAPRLGGVDQHLGKTAAGECPVAPLRSGVVDRDRDDTPGSGAEAVQHPLPQIVGHRRALREVERHLGSRCRTIGVLTAGATRRVEPPPQLCGGNGEQVPDGEGLVAGHAPGFAGRWGDSSRVATNTR